MADRELVGVARVVGRKQFRYVRVSYHSGHLDFIVIGAESASSDEGMVPSYC